MRGTAVTSTHPAPENLIALLEGDLTNGRRSPLYTLGALVVAIVMVILPIIYLLLIAGVGYLTALHAVKDVGILEGSGTRGRLLVYLGPIFAGLVVCFFMIKPLFARPLPRPEPVSLDRESAPLLFAWVERLCGMVGAPLPRRIDVNGDVNASASFEGGLWGMLRRNMVLTIGLPLAGGMSLSQFTGILAHEFGHFAQGGAMRLSYVIRSVNWWFARVVHERDAFDAGLDEAQEANVGAIVLVVMLAKGGVWLSRRILWVLMMAGNLVSTFLLRQMEYDADRCKARLEGSEAFRETAAQLHRLVAGHQQSMNQLRGFWQEKKLPDNMTAVCLANTQSLDEQAVDEYLAKVFEAKTDRWSTHPSDRDRIDHALRLGAPGILHSDLPARILVDDFEDVSRRVTEAFYRFQLGGELDPKCLRPTGDLLAAGKLEDERRQGILRFLQGRIDNEALFFPPLEQDNLSADVEDIRRELAELRARLLAARQDPPPLRNELAGRRLQLGLHLRTLPEIAAQLRDPGQAGDRSAALARTISCLQLVEPMRGQAEKAFRTALRGVQILQEDKGNRHKQRAFNDAVAELHALYMKIRRELEPVPYPFSHAEGELSCADYAARATPRAADVGLLFDSVNVMLGHLKSLYLKATGRLIEMAEEAEALVGLERLDAPD